MKSQSWVFYINTDVNCESVTWHWGLLSRDEQCQTHEDTADKPFMIWNGRNTDRKPGRPLEFCSFYEISLKSIVPAGIGRPTPMPLSKNTHKNKTPFTAHGWCGDEPGVSYPPRRRWRSSVRPDSSPAPAGRSVGWPPARSAPAALSPGGRSADSGFAALGTGSCPRKRCSSASWRKEKRNDVEIQSPWHPWFAHDT